MVVARDIMTKDVLCVHPDTSIIETIDILLENKISGVPVTDESNNLVGIVSEKDLLQILFRNDIDVKATIEPFMSKNVLSFDEEDSVTDICEFFLENNFRRVPISSHGETGGGHQPPGYSAFNSGNDPQTGRGEKMKHENKKSLESLSFSCHIAGLFSVFIGLVVTFIDLLNKDFTHIQIGIFVFAIGYALTKVASRLTRIIISEEQG